MADSAVPQLIEPQRYRSQDEEYGELNDDRQYQHNFVDATDSKRRANTLERLPTKRLIIIFVSANPPQMTSSKRGKNEPSPASKIEEQRPTRPQHSIQSLGFQQLNGIASRSEGG